MSPDAAFLKRLQTNRGKRVPYDTYWAFFRETHPHLPLGDLRHELRRNLDQLAAAEQITLPRARHLWRHDAMPELPTHVTLRRESPKRERSWRNYPWPPELDWAAAMPHLTPLEERFLYELDHRLKLGVLQEPAPLKYRSLQLTGNEKDLPDLLRGRLFQGGRLDPTILNVETAPLPLTRERIQPGGRYLIVENEEAFTSIHARLQAVPAPPYDVIALGRGNYLEQSIAWLTRTGEPVTSIEFLGDLDAAGLRTGANANKKAQQAGLPPVEPATRLHQAMLDAVAQLGHPDGYPNPKPRAREDGIRHAAELVAFLAPQHRQAVTRILSKGHRIPEEAAAPLITTALTQD